jgi:hypothetical protein
MNTLAADIRRQPAESTPILVRRRISLKNH